MILMSYDGSADAQAAIERAVLVVPSPTIAQNRRDRVGEDAATADGSTS